MKNNRTQNSMRNIFWGIINKTINILGPFILRTLIIYSIGIQYVGIGSLFSSILGVLSLAELGFGSAVVFSMYEPVAKGDKEKICILLNFYRKCYRIIGVIILSIGILIIPILKYLINGSYPNDINIYILYGIYLFNTVISYFMFAYKGSVLTAYQRNNVTSNIASILALVQYSLQIVLLFVFKSFYVYIIVTPFITILSNILTSYFVDKYYPDIKCEGLLSHEERSVISEKVKGMIYQKIGGIVLSSVDNIVISAFLGITVLSVYNNYFLIISSLFGILAMIMTSIIPSVGNAIVEQSIEKNYKSFKKFNFIYVWIVSWFSICLLCLYQHFMTIWVGKDMILPEGTMFLCVCYFFVHKWMDMNFVYQEAAGLWWQNRFIPLIAAIVNLIINITLVQIIGLPGILISTIVAVLFIYDIGYIHILFKYYFKRSPFKYVVSQLYYLIVTICIAAITYFVCGFIPEIGFLWLVMKGAVCVTIPNILFLICYHKLTVFNEAIALFKNIKKHKEVKKYEA